MSCAVPEREPFPWVRGIAGRDTCLPKPFRLEFPMIVAPDCSRRLSARNQAPRSSCDCESVASQRLSSVSGNADNCDYEIS